MHSSSLHSWKNEIFHKFAQMHTQHIISLYCLRNHFDGRTLSVQADVAEKNKERNLSGISSKRMCIKIRLRVNTIICSCGIWVWFSWFV